MAPVRINQGSAILLGRLNTPKLDSYWMPFTANRQFKAAPRLPVAAEGRQVLDGAAGLWRCNAGHGRKRIAEAVSRQLAARDYAPSFNMGHPIAFEFAERLAAVAPGPDGAKPDRIFFTGSGSESLDTALEIAIACQRAIGQGARTKVIGRERGYHGVGFGGISVGGLVSNRRVFPQIPADHLRHTHDLARNSFVKGQPEHGAGPADDLQRLVDLPAAETIAAVIVEPVAGSTGILAPPKGYLELLREIATKHGILLIFDEVITGFFGVIPDLVTTAKGLTNGIIPMGAVFTARAVHDALMTGPENAIELFHGYTYSGHPVSCAAGLAALDIYEGDGLFTRAAELQTEWDDAIHGLKAAKNVIGIRTIGLISGIELSPRAGGVRAYEVFVDCLEKGLLIRVTGDIIALSPPLIVEEGQIDEIVDVLGDVLNRVA